MKFKIAWRDIQNHRRLFMILIFNLAIGLSGFVTLEIMKDSFERQMNLLSRSLLGGDLQLSARRTITDDERQAVLQMAPGSEETHSIRTLSMVRGESRSRLIQLRGIETNYPFYGALKVTTQEDLSGVEEKRGPPPEGFVWIYPEIREQLDVRIGNQVHIGQKSYTVAGYLIEELSMSSGGAAIAPRIYMDIKDLEGSGLIQFGSTYFDVRIFKTPETISSKQLMLDLSQKLDDPALNIRSHTYSGERTARIFLYLTDFLGLVALCAIALSMVGATFLFRSHLRGRLNDIAVLNALGMPPRQSRQIYLLQLIMIGGLASAISLALGYLLLPIAYELFKGFIPFDLSFHISVRVIIATVLLGTVGAALSTLPFFQSLSRFDANRMFSESSQFQLAGPQLVYWLPVALGFVSLAFLLSNSFKIGGLFIAFFASAIIAIIIVAATQQPLLKRWTTSKRLLLRLSARTILRQPVQSITLFVSLSLALILILIVPLLQYSLAQEFDEPSEIDFPSFFLFDIQDSQINDLQATLKDLGVPVDKASPLVRARLVEVNGESFEKVEESEDLSRDEQARRQMINRGLNLSTRPDLFESESLIEGQWFSGPYDSSSEAPVELSVEHRYATRLGLKMGDRLTIEIEGIPFIGEVTSLRRVRWISFQPNFFIQVQPGVIDLAPKTHIASLGDIAPERRTEIENVLAAKFPNVSVVNVSRTINTILLLVGRLSWSMQFMTIISFIVGLIVLGALIGEMMHRKRFDLNLLKVIGADHSTVRKLALSEFTMVLLVAVFWGSLIALAITYVIMLYGFDGIWHMPWSRVLGAAAVTSALALGVCYLVTRRYLNQKPTFQPD